MCLVLCAHWVFECCGRACRTAIMLLGAKRLRGFGMHQKIIAGARRPCNTAGLLFEKAGALLFASFVVRVSDAAQLRTPRAAAAQVRTPEALLKPFWIFQS